jgi:tubulin--tyrosine ligase
MDLETLPVNMRARMAEKNTSFNALGDVAHADPNKCGATMADLLKSYPGMNTQAGKENEGKSAEPPREPDRVVAVLNSNGRLGTVYKEVSRTLARQGGWRRKKTTTAKLHMVFGEAHGAGIPYKRFSQTYRYDYGIRPLVNYYRCAKSITDKVMMVQSVKQYAGESKGESDCDFLPESFLFWPGKPQVSHHAAFEQAFDEGRGTDNVWIIKPAGNAHGDRIFLSKSKDEILSHLADQRENSSPWLVQKYCENPMLLGGGGGRKFDMRVWVLVNDNFDIFLYNQGSCRTSCEKFDLEDLRNKFVHLTNHSIQEGHPDFGKFEADAEMFFPEFEQFLDDSTDFNMREDIMPQVSGVWTVDISCRSFVLLVVFLGHPLTLLVFSLPPPPPTAHIHAHPRSARATCEIDAARGQS